MRNPIRNLNWDGMGTASCLAVVAGMGWGDCSVGSEPASSAAQTAAGASRESAVEDSPGRGVVSRAALDYHQFNGVWAAEDCEGGLTRYIPEGTGDHALQFALAQSPQTTVLWEVGPGGEVFETDQGLFVDRSASGGILFGEAAYEALESGEREPSSARVSPREPGGTSDCSGQYSGVTSYTTEGDCWSAMVVLPGGEWSQACGGEDGACKAKITRDEGVKNVTWTCGTGSAGGDANAKTGYVISARNGC